MGMHISLYRALRNAKVSHDAAEQVVEEVEGYIAMKVTEANAPLIAELKSTRTELSKEVSQVKYYFSSAIVLAGVIIAITNAVN